MHLFCFIVVNKAKKLLIKNHPIVGKNMAHYISYYNSPVGTLELIANDEHLLKVNFVQNLQKASYPNPILKQTEQELDEYFRHQRQIFTIPLYVEGTEFQEKVWAGLKTIPYGHTCSYKDIAEIIKNPKACRAVGNANNKNPISIIIPCHRVIGADKKLVGYGGGLDKKIWLLNHEEKFNQK